MSIPEKMEMGWENIPRSELLGAVLGALDGYLAALQDASSSEFEPAYGQFLAEVLFPFLESEMEKAQRGEVMSEEEVYGVFFRSGAEEYLVATCEVEEDAVEYAGEQDQASFERDIESGEGDEPVWEDFDGMHYVAPISRKLADECRYELERGFAVRVG